jgi:hypothetical protein
MIRCNFFFSFPYDVRNAAIEVTHDIHSLFLPICVFVRTSESLEFMC